MLNVLLFVGLTVFVISSATCFRFMLGPGRWLVINTMQCENPEQYQFNVILNRKKLNRTHDCFNFVLDSSGPIEDTFAYGIQIDVYKEVDGGFKFFQTLADPCGCKFLKKYAKKNMERGLILAGIHPPDCPLPKKKIEINNFVMDYRELAKCGVYGTFDTRVYGTLGKKKVGCIRVLLNFDEEEEDYDV